VSSGLRRLLRQAAPFYSFTRSWRRANFLARLESQEVAFLSRFNSEFIQLYKQAKDKTMPKCFRSFFAG